MTLVLLPGMDGTGALFAPFVTALGPNIKVKIVRYPVEKPLGYPELEAIARAALPTHGPFVILGESFSGPIAVSLAASCSTRLKGVVLCCSFVRTPHPRLSALNILVGFLPLAKAPNAALSFFLLGRFATGALRSALSQALAQVSAAVIRARLRAVMTVDVSSKMASVSVPVLYLRASHDRLVPHAASELVAKLVPRSKVIQIDAPHVLLQVAPAEAAQAVGAFIKDVQNVS